MPTNADSSVLETAHRGRIGMLTSTHSPFDVRIFHRESLSLVKAGYKVSIVAPFTGDCVRSNVSVLAVPPSAGRLARMSVTTVRILRRALAAGPFDVFHFHDPDLLPVGIVLALIGKQVVYDSHEHYYLRIQTKEWLPGWMRPIASNLVRGLEQIGSHLFVAVVGPGPEVVSQFPASKSVIIANRPPIVDVESLASSEYHERDNLVVYVGGLDFERGSLEMLDSVALASKTVDCRLALAGRGPLAAMERLQKHPQWSQVEFHGYLDRCDLNALLARGRVGLLLLHPSPQYRFALATKVFDYLAAGMPVVVPRFPVWEELLERYHCGLAVDPLNAAEVADAIVRLLSNPTEARAMGLRGREAVLSSLNWENEESKLLELYGRLVDPGRQPC